MNDCYLNLPATAQREILEAAAAASNRSAAILEKDIWLTFLLGQLFSMPDRLPMAFKGGTSLSKAYSVINRFSEDVDITVDYRSLAPDWPITELLKQGTRFRSRFGDSLREDVKRHTRNVIKPYLQHQLGALPCADECSINLSCDGERLEVQYPSRVSVGGEYLRDYVLIEFGGRNIIDPNSIFTIRPDIASMIPAVEFPQAEVVVLAAERTFWEKATLIHAACNRPLPDGINRYSRHWYDLAMLARHACGATAKTDMALLSDVIDLKNTFYRSQTTQYQRCLEGELKLIPSGDNLKLLHTDFEAMHAAGMFYGVSIELEQLLDELSVLQEDINRTALRWTALQSLH